MVERKAMVMLPAATRQELVAGLIEEYQQHQQDPSALLKTHHEWGVPFRVSASTVRRILEKADPEVLIARTKILRAQPVHAAYSAGTGTFGINPETGVRFISEGGIRGGTKSAALQAERNTGLRALTKEKRIANARIGGKVGGPIARDRKLGAMGLSQEERSKNSRRLVEEGKALWAVDPKTGKTFVEAGRKLGSFATRPEDAAAAGKKGGRMGGLISGPRVLEKGVGIFGWSAQQRSDHAIALTELLTERKVLYGENYFDSYEEAAAADLLVKYIPGFTIQRGVTYQIFNGIHKKIDFFVNGVFLEYNPIILFKGGMVGSFATMEEYNQFKSQLEQLNDDDKKAHREQVRKELLARYTGQRRQALNESPQFQDHELVVATDAADLFDLVIVRWGNSFPEKSEFIKEFNKLKKIVKKENKERKMIKDQPETVTP